MNDKINDKGIKLLSTAIVSQAVIDFKFLNSKNIEQVRTDKERFSKQEIEEFLKSDWCSRLLTAIGNHFDGGYIFRVINKQ